MSLDSGRNENLEQPTQNGGEHVKLLTDSNPSLGLDPGAWSYEAAILPADFNTDADRHADVV